MSLSFFQPEDDCCELACGCVGFPCLSRRRKTLMGFHLDVSCQTKKNVSGKARMSSYLAGNVTRNSLDFSFNLLRRAPLTVRPPELRSHKTKLILIMKLRRKQSKSHFLALKLISSDYVSQMAQLLSTRHSSDTH